jgi:hypothetical protein
MVNALVAISPRLARLLDNGGYGLRTRLVDVVPDTITPTVRRKSRPDRIIENKRRRWGEQGEFSWWEAFMVRPWIRGLASKAPPNN